MIVDVATLTVLHADGTASHFRTELLGRSALLHQTIYKNNDGNQSSLIVLEGVIHAVLRVVQRWLCIRSIRCEDDAAVVVVVDKDETEACCRKSRAR